MRLSDLLGAEVHDRDGRPLGAVRDVRLVQDGPVRGPFGAGLRVHGLVVGPGAVAARLGYDRRPVRGPWLVATLVRRLGRARYVPWAEVDRVEGRRVDLRCRAAELDPPAPLDERGRPA